MQKFTTIFDRAAERKGGKKALLELMPKQLTNAEMCELPDSAYLSAMTKKVFQAGFVWRVVENKWFGFEEVFWEFEPRKLELASDEQIERMASDKRIIRNLTKVKTVRDNAYFVNLESEKYGGFGQFIADWPIDEITQLWLYLKKHGSRLGGNTGPYFLRAVGKDTFLMTRDVVAYLVGQGIVDKQPSSQRDLKAVQTAFNDWQQQSGRSMAEISRIISCSIGENLVL
ncbi:MAG: DNA-3-methyladenine glycosylase I [Kangiellaceae bacterium]